MRIPSLRAMIILACAALVVIAGACHVCASFLNLLPSDIFSGSRAQVQPVGNTQYNFFSTVLGILPASDRATKQEMSGLLGIMNSYDDSRISLPSNSSDSNWMNNLITFGTPMDASNSAAMASYDRLIKRFANQSNIFAPYTYA